MDLETLLPLLMFAVLFLFILSGFPVAFVLGGTGLIFGLIGYWADIFFISDFGFIPSKVFGVVQNFTLIAVPLFIFMGITLEKSGLAEELLLTMELLCQRIRGGLTVSLIIVGALLAASTGIVGATVVTMGVLSLPTMLSRGYNKELSCGTIAASGTLGQIIPPSIVLVLLGDMMNVAVADLFAAALLPGLLLVGMYIAYVLTRSYLNPALAPRIREAEEDYSVKEMVGRVCGSLIPPFVLIFLVLGSILAGAASPTESAACGALGALLLAILKRKFSVKILREVMHRTTNITSMVFTLLVGAQVFAVVFRGLYGDELISDFITDLEVSPNLVIFIVMLVLFVLGFFLDFIEICFIVVPIITPLLVQDLGVNALWLAILIAINLQTSFLTPPFGFALFYLKGVCPPEVSTLHIYRGILPFVVIQIIGLALLWAFPELATWLPGLIFGSSP